MVAICPNPFRDIQLKGTLHIKKLLAEMQMDSVICPVFADIHDDTIPKDIECLRYSELKNISLYVVLGGDGTILELIHNISDVSIPILGINFGTKGFMTSLESYEIDKITDILSNHSLISTRMMINVELIHDNKIIYSGVGLNDAVIHGCGDTITINTFCNNDKVLTFSGDGLIVSTPTGSTGYSMSAGGPIVCPDSAAVIVTPICAHLLSAKSFVFNPEKIITANVGKIHDRRAYLSVDGKEVSYISDGDIVKIYKSDKVISMMVSDEINYYELVFNKLG